MKIEQVHDQGSGLLNEDVLLTGKNVFGVFDGATGHDGYLDEEGKTGGYLAAHIAESVFREGGANHDLFVLTRVANERIGEEIQRRGIDVSDGVNRWCTTVSVVRIRENDFEWAQTGDSSIVVVYKDGSFKKLPNYFWDAETLELWRKFAKQGVKDIGRLPDIETQVLKVRRLSNLTYGYLNGDPEAVRFFKHGIESLKDVVHILLYSDGFELPQEDPSADGTEVLVRLFIKHGPEYVKNYVRDIEKSDPECWKYPRFKQHDDMTAIAVSF